nr:immunoglobulin light chain junction region [Macaca mulatta]
CAAWDDSQSGYIF